jgi:hypothetical protein
VRVAGAGAGASAAAAAAESASVAALKAQLAALQDELKKKDEAEKQKDTQILKLQFASLVALNKEKDKRLEAMEELLQAKVGAELASAFGLSLLVLRLMIGVTGPEAQGGG